MRPIGLDLVRRPVLQMLCVALFAGLLVLPLFGQALSIGTDVETFEMRKPAPWPGMPRSSAEVDTWPTRFDLWLKDHFGFRNQLVLAYNLIRVKVLDQSTSPHVVRGRHDWLFFKGDNSIEQARGLSRFSDPGVDQWIDVMERRQAWLAERGIPMLMVAVPNKERVYREYLPGWVKQQFPESHLDQINRRLLERNSKLAFMDLTPDLISAKQRMKVYLKADTHWTIEAAVDVGYHKIMGWVQLAVPGFKPLTQADIRKNPAIRTGYNLDLARMIGLASVTNEDDTNYTFIRPNLFKKNEELSKNGVAINILHADRPNTPVVVWFRDSFTISMYPYIADTFGKSVMVEHKGMLFDKDIVSEHKPDVVIYQFVERFLSGPTPVD